MYLHERGTEVGTQKRIVPLFHYLHCLLIQAEMVSNANTLRLVRQSHDTEAPGVHH